ATGCDSILVLDLSVDTVYTPAVTAAITDGANPGCMDSLLEFTASGTHIGTAALYTWLVNQVPVATGSVYATQTLLTGDQVQVMVVDPDSACRTTGTSYSNSFNIVRVAKPASPLISL